MFQQHKNIISIQIEPNNSLICEENIELEMHSRFYFEMYAVHFRAAVLFWNVCSVFPGLTVEGCSQDHRRNRITRTLYSHYVPSSTEFFFLIILLYLIIPYLNISINQQVGVWNKYFGFLGKNEMRFNFMKFTLEKKLTRIQKLV